MLNLDYSASKLFMLNHFQWTYIRWKGRLLSHPLLGTASGWLGLIALATGPVMAEPVTSNQINWRLAQPGFISSIQHRQPLSPVLLQNYRAQDHLAANHLVANHNKQDELCPSPVLSRLQQHRVQPGETLESIAAQYGLIPATLLGFNPSLGRGAVDSQVPSGQTLVIPPYNGIRVRVSQGKTWQDLATQYGVRADVLFELNGCNTVPSMVFVPGVSGLPIQTATSDRAVQQMTTALSGFPLPTIAPVLRDYGWHAQPQSVNIEFHGGVDLAADVGTPVLSVGEGVVAFVGDQGDYGQLVVVNHAHGLQTRYAQLSAISVQRGQRVQRGQTLGRSGETGNAYAPHLHFEVRSNSTMGWVAQHPSDYLDHMQMFER